MDILKFPERHYDQSRLERLERTAEDLRSQITIYRELSRKAILNLEELRGELRSIEDATEGIENLALAMGTPLPKLPISDQHDAIAVANHTLVLVERICLQGRLKVEIPFTALPLSVASAPHPSP